MSPYANLSYKDATNQAEKELEAFKKIYLNTTGNSEIKIFNSAGTLLKSFLAYDAKFKGGVNIAVGDVDNDGKDEIVTAPASVGGPHIKVFNSEGLLLYQFFAYDKKMTKGVWAKFHPRPGGRFATR